MGVGWGGVKEEEVSWGKSTDGEEYGTEMVVWNEMKPRNGLEYQG